MPRALRSPESELNEFAARSTTSFQRHFTGLVSGLVRDDRRRYERSFAGVAQVIGETMTMSDLFGRRRLFLEFDAAVANLPPEDRQFAASPIVPRVPFEAAFESIVSREPRLAQSAEAVARIYQERHGFALAKSADEALTGRIQEFVSSFVDVGKPIPSAATIIAGVGDFARSYADTVYRTNLTTAYTAGRFRQAQEEGVRQILPAMERYAVRDSALRSGRPRDNGENHKAAHGLVADTRDPIWATHAPPSGYRCRRGVRMVSRPELKRRNPLEGTRVIRFTPPGFASFRAHPNFGARNPASLIYGAS